MYTRKIAIATLLSGSFLLSSCQQLESILFEPLPTDKSSGSPLQTNNIGTQEKPKDNQSSAVNSTPETPDTPDTVALRISILRNDDAGNPKVVRNIDIVEGESINDLQALVTLSDGTRYGNIHWSSDDSRVLTIEPVSGRISALKPGYVTITATYSPDPTLKAKATVRVISKSNPVLVVDLPGEPIPEVKTSIVSGKVYDSQDIPVNDAIVRVFNKENGELISETRTQAGEYIFAQIPHGRIEVKVEKTGYLNNSRLLTVAGTKLTLDFEGNYALGQPGTTPVYENTPSPPPNTPVQEPPATLQKSLYTISGKVTDKANNGLAGVTVRMQGGDLNLTDTTDTNGNYQLRAEATPSALLGYTLSVSKVGYTNALALNLQLNTNTTVNMQSIQMDRRHWTPVITGIGTDFYDVDFLDDRYGWLVGAEGTIIETENGGATWQRINAPKVKITSVKLLSRNEAWIGSEKAKFYHTTDRGSNWRQISTPCADYLEIEKIHMFSSGRISAQCLDSLIYTDNQGETFIKKNFESNISYYSSTNSTFSGSTGYFSSYGNLYTSLNEGSDWQTISKNSSISRLQFNGLHLAAIGSLRGSSGLYISSNNGLDWQKKDPPGMNVSHIEFTGPRELIAVRNVDGFSVKTYESQDLGESWVEKELYSSFGSMGKIMKFFSRTNGWSIGNAGKVHKY